MIEAGLPYNSFRTSLYIYPSEVCNRVSSMSVIEEKCGWDLYCPCPNTHSRLYLQGGSKIA